MRFLFTITIVLALTGCNDVVTTHYATLDEAKSQHAFEKGWLPPILPDSARTIVERNDLDLNTGTGTFDYDMSERPAFEEKLSQAGAVLRAEQNADVLTVTTNGSRWEIWLPRRSGQAKWDMRQH